MKRYVLSPEAQHDLSLIKSRLINDASVKVALQVAHRFRAIATK